MKAKNIIYLILGLTITAAACNIEELPGDSTISSNEEYIRLKFSSSPGKSAKEATRAIWADIEGKGNMTFKWEKTDTTDVEISNLSLIISNGNEALQTWNSPDIESDSISWSHTWLAISPLAHNSNYADFFTTRYYSQSDLEDGKYCFVIAGNTEIHEDTASGNHSFSIDMPSVFRQQKSQDPSFLREYMYMCAESEYKGNDTSLEFKHIPATLRLIITNVSSDTIALKEVSFCVSENSLSEGTQVGTTGADITFDWKTGVSDISYRDSCHKKITTVIEGADSLLAIDSSYIAYSMVLPLHDPDALKGKLLNFSIKTSTYDYLAYQVNAEKIAKANGEDIYNWVGGKSYTLKLDIGDNTAVRGRITEDNVIEITSTLPGTYTLKYEDSNGNPLSNFRKICTLDVNEFTYYENFIYANCAPREAESIGIYDIEDNRVGSVRMSGFKPKTEIPLYSIGLLSDVHCENDTRTESITDFKNALNFFKGRNVAMTCICGDITQNGTEVELSLYRQLVSVHSASIPVYSTSGNHDCPETGLDEDLWMQYIKQPLVYEQSMQLPDGSKDHFLFLGMSHWSFSNAYLEENIKWLENKLEEYRNERCFVITHLFFPDRAGNLNGIYPSYNWLKGIQLDLLQSMCDRYVNSLWISGHSHWKWELQKFQDRANIYRSYNESGEPASGWCIHVPSCANPIDSDGISTRVAMPLESQGTLLHIYENRIELLGLDLKTKQFLPVASYNLDTTLQEVEAR